MTARVEGRAEVLVHCAKGAKVQLRVVEHGSGTGTGGWWVEVSNDIARNKVSHAFRNRRLLGGGGNVKSRTMTTTATKMTTISSYSSSSSSKMMTMNQAYYNISSDFSSSSDGSTTCGGCFS